MKRERFTVSFHWSMRFSLDHSQNMIIRLHTMHVFYVSGYQTDLISERVKQVFSFAMRLSVFVNPSFCDWFLCDSQYRCWQTQSFREEYKASAYMALKLVVSCTGRSRKGRVWIAPFSLSTMMVATVQPHGPKTTREAFSEV